MSAITTTSVAVLGQGPMGRALSRAVNAAGVPLVLWNRTTARATETAAGMGGDVTVAEDPSAAVATADLLLVNLVDHAAVDEVLDRAGRLDGRTVVTVSSDTPARKRATAALVEAAGGRHLDGAIMTPADTVGTAHASVLYAGPRELFDAHAPVLERLGAAHWTGAEPGRAAAFDMALLDLFWTSMGGFAHAAALARAEGVDPTELLPHALGITGILGPIFTDMSERWAQDRHGDATSAVTSVVTSLGHIATASAERELDTAALDALRRRLTAVVDAGFGAEEFSRVIDYP